MIPNKKAWNLKTVVLYYLKTSNILYIFSDRLEATDSLFMSKTIYYNPLLPQPMSSVPAHWFWSVYLILFRLQMCYFCMYRVTDPLQSMNGFLLSSGHYNS